MDLIVDTWQEWCRVFNKVETWRPLIGEIGRRTGFSASEVRPGYGGTNAVFILDERVVVKIISPFFRNDYQRELEVYHLLEQDHALPTPRVLGEGTLEGAQPWSYMVLSLLPGERLGAVWPQVPREDRFAIARELGQFTRLLHVRPVDGIASMDTSREAWVRFVGSQTERAVEYFHEQGVPSHLLDRLPEYLQEVQPLCPSQFEPCLLNCDLTDEHGLLSLVDGHWRITGLIDFGDAEVGHADYEFVAVNLGCLWADRALLRAFLEGYGYSLDERFNQRLMGYSLLHRFADMMHWVDRFGGPGEIRSWEQLRRHLWDQ